MATKFGTRKEKVRAKARRRDRIKRIVDMAQRPMSPVESLKRRHAMYKLRKKFPEIDWHGPSRAKASWAVRAKDKDQYEMIDDTKDQS